MGAASMSNAQNETEQVMRDIHLMLSQAEVYKNDTGKIIIDKKDAQELLEQLKKCLYELMEEYELTEQSRGRAERELRRKSDAIVEDASSKAEDVYAGSVIYTDEALRRVQDIMQTASEEMDDICRRIKSELTREKETIKRDRNELKSNLEDLKDTQKYLKIIEEANRKIQKENEKEKSSKEKSPLYKPVKPEIKINEDYFRQNGIPIEDDEPEETAEEEQIAHEAPEIRVNLDAEYFRWKEGQNS
jgi:hypothetical protein